MGAAAGTLALLDLQLEGALEEPRDTGFAACARARACADAEKGGALPSDSGTAPGPFLLPVLYQAV